MELVRLIKDTDADSLTKDTLIKYHMATEKVTHIDTLHTKLFGGINTLRGYKMRYKNDNNTYPYGTPIIVCIILATYHPTVDWDNEISIFKLPTQVHLSLRLLRLILDKSSPLPEVIKHCRDICRQENDRGLGFLFQGKDSNHYFQPNWCYSYISLILKVRQGHKFDHISNPLLAVVYTLAWRYFQ